MDGDLDLPGVLVGWRFALGGGVLALGATFVLLRWRVPGAASLAGVLDGVSARVLAYERWVIDALAGAVSTVARAAAWTAAVVDTDVLGAPGDAVARRLVRAADALRPATGGSLSRVAWILVGLLGTVCLGHSVWPGR
jgi:hypothetical protein